MLGPTKKHPTDDMVTLRLRVRQSDAERIRRYVATIEEADKVEPRPWRELFSELRPDDPILASVLRGSRIKEGFTQEQLSAMTGIPRRHLSEMENGKRPIGRESARKLALAFKCDYRVFM